MSRASAWTCVFALFAAAAWPRPSPAASLEADISASQLVVRTTKRGLLSALSHDHELSPARWRAVVDLDPAHLQAIRVDVTIDAGTLHDHVARLTQSMRDHVDHTTAGPSVLDAGRYPEIRFHAESATARREGAALEGVLHGVLTLHGTTRPLDVPFRGRAESSAYQVAGVARFRQTDFGMTPYSVARGSIGVDDEIRVEFELVLVPGAHPEGSIARRGRP